MILYYHADEYSEHGCWFANQKDAFKSARENSKSDIPADELEDGEVAGEEIEVERVVTVKPDKEGVIAFLRHRGFIEERRTIACFRNGRRVPLDE